MDNNALLDDGILTAYIADEAASISALLSRTNQSVITEANRSTKVLGYLMLKLTK